MSELVLKAKKREPGTLIARALRNDDHVPGVYYTNGEDAVHFSVLRKELRPIVRSAEAKLLSLQVDGDKPRLCILKTVDFDPISDLMIHFDLLGISAGHKIKVDIPLHLVGSSVGVLGGAVLEQVMLKAHVMVDPTKMPEHIDVNIEELDVNQSIHIGDLNIDGVEFTDNDNAVIVTCAPPKVVTEDVVETPEATAEGAEGASEEGAAEGTEAAASE